MKSRTRIIAVFLLAAMLLLTLAACSPYDNPERYVKIEKYRDWDVERSYIEVPDAQVESEILNAFYDYIQFNEINEGEIKAGDANCAD